MQVGAPLTARVERMNTSASMGLNMQGFNVAVLGAAGGIGQPLCLLLKRYLFDGGVVFEHKTINTFFLVASPCPFNVLI